MTRHRADKPVKHPLSLEDRILWNKVARTVTPLDRKRHRAAQEEVWADWVAEAFGDDEQPAVSQAGPQPIHQPQTAPAPRRVARKTAETGHAPAPLEQPNWRRLARGRTPIDASIDLHAMTQDEAHSQLHRFLVQARARDCRHVLVITGKGRSPASEGVLRRMLPIWLSREPFTGLVSGVRPAARGHGGDGAFYVRLRKPADHRHHRP